MVRRVPARPHLARVQQGRLCPGTQLLLVPRRLGIVPHRLAAGGLQPHKQPHLAVRHRAHRALRHRAGAPGVWMAVSVRPHPGIAVPHPLAQGACRPDTSALPQVRRAGHPGHPDAPAGTGRLRCRRPMVLQAGLPRRDAGGRPAPDGPERVAARCRRLAVCVEAHPAGSHGRIVGRRLPPVLPVRLPAGRHLWTVQPHQLRPVDL